jgi:hypothetical protein
MADFRQFTLPLIAVTATPQDAADALIQWGRSGVVLRGDGDLRVLGRDAIADALIGGTANLVDFRGAVRCMPFERDMLLQPAGGAAFEGVLIDDARASQGYVHVFASVGNVADTLLSLPGFVKCTNPVRPDYYPPNRRSALVDPKQCFCGYPLP